MRRSVAHCPQPGGMLLVQHTYKRRVRSKQPVTGALGASCVAVHGMVRQGRQAQGRVRSITGQVPHQADAL
jgi:hypothetical protein